MQQAVTKKKKAKTQVRFNNIKDNLVLGVRGGKDMPWKFYQPGKLPKLAPDTSGFETESMDGIGSLRRVTARWEKCAKS